MRLNEGVSGFLGRCDSGGSFFGIFCGCLAGDFLFLLGGGADERDRDVAGALEDRTGGAFGPRLEAAESRAGADDGFLDDQGGRIEREIVFRVRDGGLERLANQLGSFLGSEGQNVKGVGYGQALNFTGDVTRLLGRETNEFCGAFDFHGSSDVSGYCADACVSRTARSPGRGDSATLSRCSTKAPLTPLRTSARMALP